MKKIIVSVVICFLVVMCMGCGKTNKVNAVRQQTEVAESKVSGNGIPQTAEPKTSEDENSKNERSKEVLMLDKTMVEYLNILAMSDDYDSWMKVAECKGANEGQLLTIAEKAKTSALAKAIIDNGATTAAVMEKLANSEYFSVRCEVMQSYKASEKALLILAEDCDGIGNTGLADIIISNPSTTDAVMEKLANSGRSDVWKKVAKSDKASEKALLILAEHCASGHSGLVDDIIENNATTDAVIERLADIDNINVLWAIAKSDKASEEVLLFIAEKYDGSQTNSFLKCIEGNLKRRKKQITLVNL